jgi:hypothetical protein
MYCIVFPYFISQARSAGSSCFLLKFKGFEHVFKFGAGAVNDLCSFDGGSGYGIGGFQKANTSRDFVMNTHKENELNG